MGIFNSLPFTPHAINGFFEQPERIQFASAPGRVDVMGGISDYAGGLVLEGTIAERAHVAIAPRRDWKVRIKSLGYQAPDPGDVEWDLGDCLPEGDSGVPPLRRLLQAEPQKQWSAYVAGVLTALIHHYPELRQSSSGWDILLHSQVPSGAGVSSSAAIEIATLRALTLSLKLKVDGLATARICQWAENYVVGAPCGIMDQVTSALGRQDELLALLCQPCDLKGYVQLPSGVGISCINSNVKHSVAGAHYSNARIGAFMGLGILRHAGAFPSPQPQDGLSKAERRRIPPAIAGMRALEYLCQLDAQAYTRFWARLVPARLTGVQYLARYGAHPDDATTIDLQQVYMVRACTTHPIYERRRVESFRDALGRATDGGAAAEGYLVEAGKQLYASDWSYNYRVGLGSRETRLLVKLVRRRGPDNGLYGARVTGGGSGGTVVVLHRTEAAPQIEQVARQYEALTGIPAHILSGSSAGAWVG